MHFSPTVFAFERHGGAHNLRIIIAYLDIAWFLVHAVSDPIILEVACSLNIQATLSFTLICVAKIDPSIFTAHDAVKIIISVHFFQPTLRPCDRGIVGVYLRLVANFYLSVKKIRISVKHATIVSWVLYAWYEGSNTCKHFG